VTGTTAGSNTQAKFLEGTIMRHVVVMTLTSALGLMAMFMVDLADLFFLSVLKQTEVTAAIGFAGTIAFANLSMLALPQRHWWRAIWAHGKKLLRGSLQVVPCSLHC
jgi:uncharacterized transporter YbjL